VTRNAQRWQRLPRRLGYISVRDGAATSLTRKRRNEQAGAAESRIQHGHLGSMRSHRWCLATVGVLALLLLRATWQLHDVNTELDRLYVNEVAVKAIDAESREPLHIVLSGPSVEPGRRWPKGFTIIGTGDSSQLRVRWVDVGPVEVAVSAEGYTEQRLQLDERSDKAIVVALPSSAR
jgi:hypothetical protein